MLLKKCRDAELIQEIEWMNENELGSAWGKNLVNTVDNKRDFVERFMKIISIHFKLLICCVAARVWDDGISKTLNFKLGSEIALKAFENITYWLKKWFLKVFKFV